MKFNLKRPCAQCPFRHDIRPFLTRGGAEDIVESLERSTFPCHKTLDYDNCDDDGRARETEKSAHCAGALIMLEKMEQPSQMMRIAERLGLYDRRQLDMESPVFDEADEFIDAQHG